MVAGKLELPCWLSGPRRPPGGGGNGQRPALGGTSPKQNWEGKANRFQVAVAPDPPPQRTPELLLPSKRLSAVSPAQELTVDFVNGLLATTYLCIFCLYFPPPPCPP